MTIKLGAMLGGSIVLMAGIFKVDATCLNITK